MWQGLKEILQQTADEHGYDIIESEVMPDHVHCFVSAAPKVAPSTIVRHLKGASARRMFQSYPSLRHRMWRGHLWPGTSYIGTAGNVSAATIKRYIQGQHTA
jgi:putative transposase